MHVIMFPLVVCSNHCMIFFFFFPFSSIRPCFLRWSSWVYSQQSNVTVIYIYVCIHINIHVCLYVYRCCMFMIYLNSSNSSGFRWKMGHLVIHLKSVWHDTHPSEIAETLLLHPDIAPQVFTWFDFQTRTWKQVISPFTLKREGSSFIRNSFLQGNESAVLCWLWEHFMHYLMS